MGLLKTQPAFDYYQAMFRAVFSVLVDWFCRLAVARHALTFKSDGSVIQNDGTVVQSPNDSVAAKAAKKETEAQATKTETISNNQQIVNNTLIGVLIASIKSRYLSLWHWRIQQSQHG